MLDSLPLGVLLLAPDGELRLWNAALLRLTGCAASALRGALLWEALPSLAPHREAILSTLASGRAVQIDPSTAENGANRPAPLVWEFRPLNGDGILGCASEATPALPVDHRMIRSERLAAIGELAAGVAHNFNNILAAIGGDAQLLKIMAEEDSLPDYVAQAANAIYDETMRGGRTAADLLSFARGQEPKRAALDLRTSMQDTLRLIRNHPAFKNVSVEQSLDADLPRVEADANQLHQVFFNLILNALQAMPNGGILSISARVLPSAEDGSRGKVEIKFSDTGIGIPEDKLSRIFTPFYSSRPDGSTGTGLGLTVSLAMIRSLGGEISLTSAEGIGTTVSVALPIVERRGPARNRSTGGAGRVLIVDEEPSVRRTLNSLLTRQGYEVTAAAAAEEALRLFEGDGESQPFDLVILDLMLPRFGGAEAVAAIHRVDPELPVVAITGVSDREKIRAALQAGARFAFQKPLNMAELLAVVSALVGERRLASDSGPVSG